jgi:hypothetical protein
VLSLGLSPEVSEASKAPLSAPTNVHVTTGNGTATVSWGASYPTKKVSYYLVLALKRPSGPAKFLKTKSLQVTFRNLTKGARYSFSVGASGKNSLKVYSPIVNAGTFTIPGGGVANSGGGSGGGNSSASLIDNCALVLGNWVISTSNANQADPQGLPPIIMQFGGSSEITQWVLGQLGTFMANMYQQGQSAADAALIQVSKSECAVLQNSGVDIASIPASQ